MGGWIDEFMVGWVVGFIGGWMDGWITGWMVEFRCIDGRRYL